jgi:hypothetical protein
MSAVERFCDRAMLIERGKVLSIDAPHAIARAYNELNFGRIAPVEAVGQDRFGDHEVAEIKAGWFENAAGERVAAVAQGEPLRLCAEVAFHTAVEHPLFAMHLRNEVRHVIFATSTDLHQGPTGRFEAGETATVRIAMENWLAPGRYDLTPTVARQGGGADVLDLREDLADLIVHGTRHSGGVVEIPHTLELERS